MQVTQAGAGEQVGRVLAIRICLTWSIIGRQGTWAWRGRTSETRK